MVLISPVKAYSAWGVSHEEKGSRSKAKEDS